MMKTLKKCPVQLCLVATLILSCDSPKVEPSIPDPPSEVLNEFVGLDKIFGFDEQSRYAYAPSVVKEEDGTTHMYFCGNPEEELMVDHIYHIRINPDGTQTPAKSVVQPGEPGEWDDHHICDPSVIAGEFQMGGKSYGYAMFYLTNQHGVYFNEIGMAFSNDLEADKWVKYPHRIVPKTWSHDGDQLLPGASDDPRAGGRSWGVGQPSAISLDEKSKVLLTYTIGDISGTRIAWVQLDLDNMDDYTPVAPTRMVEQGLMNMTFTAQDYTCNADFALDREENIIVMVRPVQPHPQTYPAYLNESLEVNHIPLDEFLSGNGKWGSLLRIAPYMTGYPRNHNAGLQRDLYGYLDKWNEPTVYYTVSSAEPDVRPESTHHAEWTYDIWKGKVSIP